MLSPNIVNHCSIYLLIRTSLKCQNDNQKLVMVKCVQYHVSVCVSDYRDPASMSTADRFY